MERVDSADNNNKPIHCDIDKSHLAIVGEMCQMYKEQVYI